ncbi:MAG: c-type cytochrome [Planctomycetota bacterium]|jgi:mono/diheme cytochrome c family protein
MIPRKIQEWLGEFELKWYDWRFKATLIAILASAFVVPLLFLALPYLELFNDMAVQPKGKTQGYYGHVFNESIIVERPAVAGTLPMGYFPYPYEGKDEKTQKIAEEALGENPVKPTMKVLEEGRKLYNYYCWTCHGKEGQGDGPIVGPERFPAPPSLHTDTAREFKDGRIFHVITRGQNTMPSYEDKFTPEERWAIIHYVHALQRAMNPEPEDIEK